MNVYDIMFDVPVPLNLKVAKNSVDVYNLTPSYAKTISVGAKLNGMKLNETKTNELENSKNNENYMNERERLRQMNFEIAKREVARMHLNSASDDMAASSGGSSDLNTQSDFSHMESGVVNSNERPNSLGNKMLRTRENVQIRKKIISIPNTDKSKVTMTPNISYKSKFSALGKPMYKNATGSNLKSVVHRESEFCDC